MAVTLSGHHRKAYVRLKSPGWDLSGYRCITMDITNHGQVGIGVLGSISVGGGKTSAESFVWVEPGQTEKMVIVFFRSQLPEYMERLVTGMRGYPGGFLSHWITPDLSKLNRITISKARPHQEMHFSVDDIQATGEYRLPTEEELKSSFFPFVDQYGQYRHAQWPGKTTSQDDIDSQHQAELKDLASNRGPEDWNQYGGWTAGPQLNATGHFRTQKLDKKWWLVDPSGRLFWSQGVTGVRLSQTTSTRRREHYFVDLVDRGDFRQANLKRKFGDNWDTEAAHLTHTRFRSWGLNTFANWSDPELYGMGKTPYVVDLWSGIAKEVPAQLNEKAFETLVRKRITAGRVAEFKDDPWCMGVFVDNELRWPKENVGPVAETYYKVVNQVLKEFAPNVLYLGSRIHGSGEPHAAYTAAAKHCDVVSVNRYQFAIVDEDLPPDSLDKPMIIGEFHFGALDRGLLHTGLRAVSNQHQRACAYTDYVKQALENDRIVGAHWFQHTDQLVSGRSDGENFQIGFVDIVDRPYPEMVAASRRLAAILYEYRYARRKSN
ncbi:hypothetical protein [Aporhodopirellula aestuarii]|nr:hypothetical protein [Aporhodopirellula aestuarii]